MEKRRRWTICVALDDAELRAKGSLFVEMCELLMRRVDAARVKTAVVLVQATGEHHFNALEQLSRLCFEHRIWNGVFQPLVNLGKQMVAYVPQYSSSGSVQREIERLGSTVGLTVATQVETFDDVPMLVIDTLVQALLFQEIQAHGAMVFGDAAERQIVFADLNQTTEAPTVVISHPRWHIDPYRRSIQITMTCVPATMALTTLGMNSTDLAGSHIADNGMCESRVQVLPRMTECFVVSRHKDPPAPTHLLRASWRTGLQRYVPTSEQEFRDYWSNVHGIDLPEDIGGFVRVRFSNRSILTYPACCVVKGWRILYRQTRFEAMDTLRVFMGTLRSIFGSDNVSATSPEDAVQKSVVFLPASALISQPNTTEPSRQPIEDSVGKKRRMITREKMVMQL